MRKGFSLIELLIVIVIIGVVYTLVIVKLDKAKEQQEVLSLATLKEYLQAKMGPDDSAAEMVCLDDCSECAIYVDGEKVQSVKDFLDNSVTLYMYDYLQGLITKEPDLFFDERGMEQNVCFRFRVDKEGVGDQVIVEYKSKVYDYTHYFHQTPVYDSTEALLDAKEKLFQEVR